jgi:hypothetical protein
MVELKRLPEAEEFNIQAEKILLQLRRQVGVAYCKLNLARIAEQCKDFKKALAYAKEATLFVQYGDRGEIAADLQRIQEKAIKVKPRTQRSFCRLLKRRYFQHAAVLFFPNHPIGVCLQ